MIINLSDDYSTSRETWRAKAAMTREFAGIEVKGDMRLYLLGKAQAYEEIADYFQELIDKMTIQKEDICNECSNLKIACVCI
jgi:hypothetical protein